MVLTSEDRPLKWLVAAAVVTALLYFWAVLFIPMLFGLLIAFVMYPICLYLEQKGLPKSIAITICLSAIFALFMALIALLGWQLQLFRADIPEILQKLKPLLTQLRVWLYEQLSVTIKMQDEWLQRTALNSGDKIGVLFSNAFSATANTLFMLFLTPIYTALFLYHRARFVRSVELLVSVKHREELRSILSETIYSYSKYIKGMVLVYLIVGILNSVGLLALGIRHAILFGMITAIMTIIPYVGIIISASLPIAIAFVTKDSIWYPLGVILVFVFVQYLEANIIFPVVVGKQLNVSTWATLVAIVAGGIIWGVAGMILFIPFLAIVRVVAERVRGFKALFVLLDRTD